MASKTQEEARLTDYLLGRMSEHERARLEEAYFADDEAFERMLIAEDELIDAYVRGALSAEERERFVGAFMASPRGLERVRFARTLSDAVSDARPRRAPARAARPSEHAIPAVHRTRNAALGSALAVAALVLVASLIWLLVERARTRDELLQSRAEHAALRERAQESGQRADAERKRSEELLTQLEAVRARPMPETGEGERAAPREHSPPDVRRPRGRVGNSGGAVARRSPDPSRGGGRAGTPNGMANAEINPAFKTRSVAELPRSTTDVSFDFVLTPGRVRGGGPNTLLVPAEATSIKLRLKLDAASLRESYSAVIETAEGRRVWSAKVKTHRTGDASVKPRGTADAEGAIDLPAVPARTLPPRDYVLLLSGHRPDGSSEVVADYSFRIARK